MLLPPNNTALFFFLNFFGQLFITCLHRPSVSWPLCRSCILLLRVSSLLPSQGKTRRQVPLLGQPPPRSDFKKLYPNSDPGLITNLKLTILCMVAFLCSFLLQKLFNFTYCCWIRVVQGFWGFFCCFFF